MAAVFENPANGHREEVDVGASICAFLFGAIYLLIKGLWSHVFIYLLVVCLPAAMGGGPWLVIAVPVMAIIYASTIQSILSKRYLNRGWIEVGPEAKPGVSSGRVPVRPDMDVKHKKCPYCAEEVRVEAIKCKHCQSDLAVN